MNEKDIRYLNVLVDGIAEMLDYKPQHIWSALHLQRYNENWLEIEIVSQLFSQSLLGRTFEFRGFDTPYAIEGSKGQKNVDILLATRDGTTHLWLELKTANLDVPNQEKRTMFNRNRRTIKEAADALWRLDLDKSVELWDVQANVVWLRRQKLNIEQLKAEARSRSHIAAVLALGCGLLEDSRSLVDDRMRKGVTVIERKIGDSEWLILLGRSLVEP